MIGPRRYHLLGLLLFLLVCALLAFPRMGLGQEKDTPRHLQPGYNYYTCEFLGYCPDEPGETYVPEMWQTVKCYPAVGKVCPPEETTER